MKLEKLLRKVAYFQALSEELPKNSSNLKEILKNIESLDTYAARKEYAEDNLKHLSSGSSRLVYLTDNDTVIKLASNDKGIAQNKVEAKLDTDSRHFNKVLNNAKDYSWIETYYLEKINVGQFEEMTGLKFSDFSGAISYGLNSVSKSGDKKPDNFQDIDSNDFYKDILEVALKFKLLPGDMARISSWGEKDGEPVLIDAGLTDKVYDDFYAD